ncbi:hypothetical protein RHS04_01053 [Rhizoctonia solani]|uniref:Uncharacterized protein n=1 Tax=Rhizoctonia solani TaxID=456999 RepID=A0A8H7HHS2_9AGAM|nr:hypothetical protein RHS04_01053 [Rhizoctonia solani]
MQAYTRLMNRRPLLGPCVSQSQTDDGYPAKLTHVTPTIPPISSQPHSYSVQETSSRNKPSTNAESRNTTGFGPPV